MRSEHPAMSFEDFERLPRRLGWKHEYWDGRAHLSPRSTVVCQALALSTRAVPVLGWPVRSPTSADRSALIEAFVDAFRETVEYCDCSLDQVKESASRAIDEYSDRKHASGASRVAIVEGGVLGAALIVQRSRGPHLDALLVRPRSQRQGVATALVASAVNALQAAGETVLRSCSVLANTASLAWHRGFGFEEEPDLMLARLRLAHVSSELRRLAGSGAPDAQAEAELRAACERFERQVEILEARAEREGFEAVTPLLLD